eukprot:TRINITY_DN13043_c0_g1_i2.p1 TRINITY_DN13043_c0_g1~~TRINITY_DN13043_c0_g1_i2.p1  ORF type:complete len:322 (+),score=37.23 TRINITY_DN13043_c0_g1_i2:52-966(+)
MALLLLRHAAKASAISIWKASPRQVNETFVCLRPENSTSDLSGGSFDSRLINTPLVPGRRCYRGHCKGRSDIKAKSCYLVVLSRAVTSSEAADLIVHGRNALDKKGSKSIDALGKQQDVDPLLSAESMDYSSHLLFLFILERLRQLIALAAGTASSWVRLRLSYLSLCNAMAESSFAVHCDESSNPYYHHSAVLWLTPQDQSTGGEVRFWHPRRREWQKTISPAVGKVALFSSGWENIHQIMPLREDQERWSLPMFTSIVQPDLSLPGLDGRKRVCESLFQNHSEVSTDLSWNEITLCATSEDW